MLASLNYRGKISVTFPATHSVVTIDTEPKSIATTFRSFFATPKQYQIDAVWPYANFPPRGPDAETRTEPRRCVMRTEEAWFQDWKEAIRNAILEKRRNQAWVGLEDWMEVMMTPNPSQKIPRPWGMDE